MGLPVEEVFVRKAVAKVTLRNARDKPGIAAEVFDLLAEKGINAEMIVSAPPVKGRSDIALVVLESEIPKILEMEDELVEAVDGKEVIVDKKIALLIFYGGKDYFRVPGVAAKIFNMLAEAGVNVEMVSASFDSLSVVVREDRLDRAIDVIRENLGIEPKIGYEEI